MRVFVINSEYVNKTSKKGNALNGFFVEVGYPKKGVKGYKVQSFYLSMDVLEGVVPEPGAVLDVETDFGSTFVEAVKQVDDVAFATAFFAPFQKVIAQINGK